MSLFSIFQSPEEKLRRQGRMMGAIAKESRLILGLLAGSILVPMMFGEPAEYIVVYFALTLIFFMPCIVAVVMLIKYLRSIY